MQGDINLIFSSAQTVTGASNVASTGTVDLAEGVMLTGTTYDNPPPTLSTGSAGTLFGGDFGIGFHRLYLSIFIGTAFTGGTSLNIAIQGAPDNLGGTIAGLVWQTYAESGPQLTVNLKANTKFPMPDWPHRAIGAALPRFIRLLYQPVGTFAAGTINFAGFTLARPDSPSYPSGFVVAA